MLLQKYNVIRLVLITLISCFNFNKGYTNQYDGLVIKVAAPTYNPPNVIDIGSHKMIGSDIEILKEVTKKTGIQFAIDAIEIAEIIASLSVDKHQIALGCFVKTPARAEQVGFSRSLYPKAHDEKGEPLAIISSYVGYSKLSQLKTKKVACIGGTLQYDAVFDFNKNVPKNKQIIPYVVANKAVAMQLLQNKKVDAVITHIDAEENYKKLANSGIFSKGCTDLKRSEDDGCHILFSKKLPQDIKNAINNEINQLIDSGKTDQLYKEQDEKYNNYIKSKRDKEKYRKALLSILKGLPMVLHITLCSILFGTIVAIILVCLRYSKIKLLKFIAKSYITIVRGLPVLLQMSFVFFILPTLLKVEISVFMAGVISLSLCCSAYIAEVIRSGINSIDKGQYEACKSLNLSKIRMVKDVIAPQVFINSLPALINTIVALIKETSLLSTFGAYEIMKRANLVIADYYTYFIPLTIAGIAYLILTFSLEKLSEWCEKRKKY